MDETEGLSLQLNEPKPGAKTKDKCEKINMMCIYDFDQTISSAHVFHKTQGASVEQIRDQYKKKDFEDWFETSRLTYLKEHFETLRSLGVELRIISFGLVDVIHYALKMVGLDNYFEKDLIFGQDSPELQNVQGQKHRLIKQFMESLSLEKTQVVFVDDDPRNIEATNKDDVCLTVYIDQRKGMQKSHIDQLNGYFNTLAQLFDFNDDGLLQHDEFIAICTSLEVSDELREKLEASYFPLRKQVKVVAE